MTPAGEIIRDKISREGPILFSDFMQIALYHPEVGYYRRRQLPIPTDPFGVHGDFYTAAQVQPVFGRLIAQYAYSIGVTTVVDLGAGREEMRNELSAFRYVAVDVDGRMPEGVDGLVFANEFFDALPVDALVRRGEGWLDLRVASDEERFVWHPDGPTTPERAEIAMLGASGTPDGGRIEVCTAIRHWLALLAQTTEHVLVLDYGYNASESARFPEGTLMSYRRHRATGDVLTAPGTQDITAHVAFSFFLAEAQRQGFRVTRDSTMAAFLLSVGERDAFADALASGNEAESRQWRGQLKTLLFSMGESFRAIVLER